MRRLINSTYITLDGVIEGPHLWPRLDATADDRAAAMQIDLIMACDAVLMGRRTYDVFAPVWPTRSGDPLSDRINAIPKYVVSKTLKNPAWANTTVVVGDVGDKIKKLKEQDGLNIVQYGFGSVSKLLMEHGLLDELRLWLYPQTIGLSQLDQLFSANATQAQFRLAESTTLSNGIIVLRYQVIAMRMG
ncbi:MAG TPA: dihydrofolate reductase family protein [Gemmatimonadaceae bacterium]|nr:dihydrofolate reductase family protein [Gemmatimonadaceae bacterium]